jgi:hypothetical protein
MPKTMSVSFISEVDKGYEDSYKRPVRRRLKNFRDADLFWAARKFKLFVSENHLAH